MFPGLFDFYRRHRNKPCLEPLLQALDDGELVRLPAGLGSFKRFLLSLLACHFSEMAVQVESALYPTYTRELRLFLGDKLFTEKESPELWLEKGGVWLTRSREPIPSFSWYRSHKLKLQVKEPMRQRELIHKLQELGISRDETKRPSFLIRGENFFLFLSLETLRIALPFDQIESIRTDEGKELSSYTLSPQVEAVPRVFPEDLPLFLAAEGGEPPPRGLFFGSSSFRLNLPLPEAAKSYAQAFPGNVRKAIAENRGKLLLWVTSEEKEILRQKELLPILPHYKFTPSVPAVYLFPGQLQNGFRFADLLSVFTDRELNPSPRTPFREFEEGLREAEARKLSTGDFLVHIEHGIARFEGFVTRDGKKFFQLGYASNDKLYVPIEKRKRLHRYISSSGQPPKLTRLGGGFWEKTKEKIAQKTKELAFQLLAIESARLKTAAPSLEVEGEWLDTLVQSFPYEETEDQRRAFEEIKNNLQQRHPMDRILLGDVGFGKTELALRAALIAAMNGKQVALLAPTTLLAHQHYRTFQARLAPFPLHLRLLSRYVPEKERAETLQELKEHRADILVGTHALLHSQIHFADLGLFIVDEEQRFGVLQKESIREKFPNTHCLTLTATPIPRTLYMTLLQLRPMSQLRTPLPQRHPVKTTVLPLEKEPLQEAVKSELERGGRVFFVVPKIAQMDELFSLLNEWLPEVPIGTAHGKMKAAALEQAMISFMEGATPFLLCTGIVQNGLDIPEANTMFIYEPQSFGLAQLYQLRGRVGRSYHQAACYLLLPSNSKAAALEKIASLLQHQNLGAGYALAKRDLELRGCGNILGKEQSGFVNMVGLTLYTQMLKEHLAQAYEGGMTPTLPLQLKPPVGKR